MKPKFFDVSFRTAYAQASELAWAQREVPLLTAGSLQPETRGAGTFFYRYRYDANGKRIAEYLGPEHDAGSQARVAEAEAEIIEAATMANYSRDLRKIGFHSTDNSTLITVAALYNAGIFGGGGILVGTHAFGALLNELGVAGAAIAMTEDIDLARHAPIQIAALPKGGFLALLASTGLPFQPVPQLERNEPPVSFKVRGKRLKVDLLVPSRGEAYKPVEIAELGAHATGLPHLEYLLEQTTNSILLGRDRIVPVVVPHAGRYCVHKLALYSMRAGASSKGHKDLQQAALLAAVLSQQAEYMLGDAIDAAGRMLRSKARPGARKLIDLLREEHPQAADLLKPLA